MLTSTPILQEVTDLALLSPEESAEAVQTVLNLRRHWVLRNLYAPFYTLGTASYLDATGVAPRYPQWAREFNPILREHFGWLYLRLLRLVEQTTGDRAMFPDSLALPGFHIYLSSPLFERPMASVHCDSQFNLHAWPAAAELDQPISFTLSLALPETGGGLYTWKVMASEIQANAEGMGEMMRNSDRAYHSYRVGSVALHSGNLLHQAAPARSLGPEDKRITLQGHGVRVDGVWQLYW